VLRLILSLPPSYVHLKRYEVWHRAIGVKTHFVSSTFLCSSQALWSLNNYTQKYYIKKILKRVVWSRHFSWVYIILLRSFSISFIMLH
jgi:hypothetical protein